MVKPKGRDKTKIRVCKVRVENKPHFGNVLPCGLYIMSKSMQPSYRGGYVFFIKPTMKTKHLLTR